MLPIYKEPVLLWLAFWSLATAVTVCYLQLNGE